VYLALLVDDIAIFGDDEQIHQLDKTQIIGGFENEGPWHHEKVFRP